MLNSSFIRKEIKRIESRCIRLHTDLDAITSRCLSKGLVPQLHNSYQCIFEELMALQSCLSSLKK